MQSQRRVREPHIQGSRERLKEIELERGISLRKHEERAYIEDTLMNKGEHLGMLRCADIWFGTGKERERLCMRQTDFQGEAASSSFSSSSLTFCCTAVPGLLGVGVGSKRLPIVVNLSGSSLAVVSLLSSTSLLDR